MELGSMVGMLAWRLPRIGIAAALLAAAVGCASLPEEGDGREARIEANDPLEPFNRAMFSFNRSLDSYLLKPVAEGYVAVIPRPARTGIRNALDNLNAPIVFMNDLLQGELERAVVTLTRFAFNSTLGMGGLVDFMAEGGMEGHSEDFGQTLAVWGVPEGPYLVLPLLGPRPPRDLAGFAVDSVADPFNRYMRGQDHGEAVYARTGIDMIDQRSRVLGKFEELERTSLDFYSAVRSSYRQRREIAINNGQADPQTDLYNLPPLDDPAADGDASSKNGSNAE
ncbi:hypothetical protein CVT23_18885 [Minwuia thermotolerans]|uniref:VacJ family lipoprotein n=2 Tax=Minwuia thermotolerans TaxID=2056226 RepID=A0A2M9FXA9_9PROT|nr:hypothetical protein CVT23_18885 [Minwuia thermotolerans]